MLTPKTLLGRTFDAVVSISFPLSLLMFVSGASAQPSITAVSTSPNPPVLGQQFTINISGNNFNSSTAQILFTGPGCNPCTVPNGVLGSKTSTFISGPATLNTAGNYTVTVQNGSGGATSNGQSLAIGAAAPSITGFSTSPNPPVEGQQFTINISGNNFSSSTAQILFTGPGCNPCTVPNGVLGSKTSTFISGPVTLNTAGNYTVTVQNGSGGATSNGQSLAIGAAAPSTRNAAREPVIDFEMN